MLEKLQQNTLKAIDEIKQIENALADKEADAKSRVAVSSKMIRPMSKLQKGPMEEDKSSDLEKQISQIISGIFS